MTPTIEKHAVHLGVRFYRAAGIELILVPLVDEVSRFVRMAGDGYFLVVIGDLPGTSYPLNLRSRASFDADYLRSKFRLSSGAGCSPHELAEALRLITEDLQHEEALDR